MVSSPDLDVILLTPLQDPLRSVTARNRETAEGVFQMLKVAYDACIFINARYAISRATSCSSASQSIETRGSVFMGFNAC